MLVKRLDAWVDSAEKRAAVSFNQRRLLCWAKLQKRQALGQLAWG